MWRVLASLLGAAVVVASRTAAASTPPVHLEVEHCESLDEASIRRIFAADLGAPTTVEAGPEVTEVNVSCEGDRVVVRVKDPLSRKTLKRSFDPKSFGNQGQSRLIAIAASELVLASWAELTENPTPTVPGEGEPANAETVETARSVVKARSAAHQRATPPASATPSTGASEGERANLPAERAPRTKPPLVEPTDSSSAADLANVDRGTKSSSERPGFDRVLAVVSARSFLNGSGTLFGGGARLAQDRYGLVSWAADALVESGKLSGEPATSATIGGSLAFNLHRGPLTMRLGAGLRAGVVGLVNGAAVAPWGWPTAVASVTVRAGPIVIDLGGEGGWVSILLKRTAEVQGFWASGQVGFGFVL